MCSKVTISFPHMGDYGILFKQFMRHILPEARVLTSPPITQHTLEAGSRCSPDFICAPFKFNMGNYIEALEEGANVLFQTGMGCRFGYYGELQEQILRDMGYEFKFICLSRQRANLRFASKSIRELGCTLSVPKIIHAGLLAGVSVRIMDRFDKFMRENVGFETVEGSFEAVRSRLHARIEGADSLRELHAATAECKKAAARIKTDKPDNPPRVGLVGDLFTLMEPFSNFYVEKQLAKEGIAVSRAMNAMFLLFGPKRRRAVRKSGGYLMNPVGANGIDSVWQSLSYAKKGYDGIIHMKSFGCIPELNAAPALMNISRDWGIPVLSFSFDSHTSETGVLTRLEAFSDMIYEKREEKNASDSKAGNRRWIGLHQGRSARLQ